MWIKTDMNGLNAVQGVPVICRHASGQDAVLTWDGQHWTNRHGQPIADQDKVEWYMQSPPTPAVDMLVDADLEARLIGTVLLEPDVILPARKFVLPDCFGDKRNVPVWETILKLTDNKIRPAFGNVVDALADNGWMEQAGGEDRLLQMASLARGIGPVGELDAPVWAKRVLDLSQRRAYRNVCARGQILAERLDQDIDQLWNEATAQLLVSRQIVSSDYKPLGSAVERVKEMFLAWFRGETPNVVKTGIRTLDHKIIGLGRRQLTTICGQPGSGKTLLAQNIAEYAESVGHVVMMAQLEMAMEELLVREVARMAQVNAVHAQRGMYAQDPEAQSRVLQALTRIANRGMLVNDSSYQSALDIYMAAQMVKLEKGRLDLVIVDYAELVKNDGMDDENTLLQIVTTSRRFKALAKDLDCSVVILAQVNKGAYSKVPTKDDIMYGGAAESDSVLGIFWPWSKMKNEPDWQPPSWMRIDPDILLLSVSKARHGETGQMLLRIDGSQYKITDHPDEIAKLPLGSNFARA